MEYVKVKQYRSGCRISYTLAAPDYIFVCVITLLMTDGQHSNPQHR